MTFFGAEIKHFPSKNYIRLRNKLESISEPSIMGILNLTEDSFYAPSRRNQDEEIKNYLELCRFHGVKFMDIGACSTRPGSSPVSEKSEIERLIPVIELIRSNFPEFYISVDTFRSQVADKALQSGADIINDVYSGREDESIWSVCAKHQAPYILTHSRGTATNMQSKTDYKDLISEVLSNLSVTLNQVRMAGINDVILDLGFGFAKKLDQNYELLRNLQLFQLFELPILCGFSRKSMITNKLGVDIHESLNGTSILNTFALTQGAQIIRVHDPKEASEILKLLK